MSNVGRPIDENRAYYRDLYDEWSEKTFTRYYSALKRVQDLGAEGAWVHRTLVTAADRAARPRGPMNVSEFVRACDEAIAEKMSAPAFA